jgi:hypothetical protein
MMPTAMSTTLPRMMNALKSLSTAHLLLVDGDVPFCATFYIFKVGCTR